MFDTRRRSFVAYAVGFSCLLLGSDEVFAQLAEKRQTQQSIEGINKTLAQQIGAGQGDEFTPDSSILLINRDPFRSIRRGRQSFQRKFTVAQGLGPRTGDGNGSMIAERTMQPSNHKLPVAATLLSLSPSALTRRMEVRR